MNIICTLRRVTFFKTGITLNTFEGYKNYTIHLLHCSLLYLLFIFISKFVYKETYFLSALGKVFKVHRFCSKLLFTTEFDFSILSFPPKDKIYYTLVGMTHVHFML